MKTIDKIITKVDGSRGAPMGRANVGTEPKDGTRIYDCKVPMIDYAYDKGGAYWGTGAHLRVRYTKDLSYIEFYRHGDRLEEKFAPLPTNDQNFISEFRFRSIQILLFWLGDVSTNRLKYEVYQNGELVFSGSDFRLGMATPIDTVEAPISLAGFITLQKGDTDDDYFKDYTDKQWAFTESDDAESLRLLVSDYDSGDKQYVNDAKKKLKKCFTSFF